uniref:Uncharacterized protein n=1 Tax=Nelumbo nucifera TaxID=4432 RepID=A0A822XZS0_NELNU|nr:TPA_asm: hypothetical protein HUJ06_025759 [Nelumbo nucifera]
MLKKVVNEHQTNWADQLSNTLWAYRTSKREATGTYPYKLVYGQEAMLPTKIQPVSTRVAQHLGKEHCSKDMDEALYTEDLNQYIH